MRRNGKRFASCLLVMALALALMAGCGAKSDDIEVKSLGQELFPETTGLLDTLKMVQEGGGSSAASAKSEGKAKEVSDEAKAEPESNGEGEGQEPESEDKENGRAVVLDVGFITEITDSINSPDDVYGEYITINDAFGVSHEVCINCMQGYEDDSTYEWYMSYSLEGGTTYITNVTGDKLEYLGLYYFGLDTEEVSVILTATDNSGVPHTLIASYLYYDDDMYWRYWTTEGSVNQGMYVPMEGAFEDYADNSVTVGGKKYKLNDDMTLIPD